MREGEWKSEKENERENGGARKSEGRVWGEGVLQRERKG